MAKQVSPMKAMRRKVHLKQYIHSGKHWSELKFFDHMMQDALVKHILGLSQYSMTDLGEVMETLGQMKSPSENDWVAAWNDMALRVHARAQTSEAKGRKISAATAYLRASTYWRIALMFFSEPEDARTAEYTRKSCECYERYLVLSGYPGQYVKIPYEGTYLPGYFYRSPAAQEKAPLLIITPGRDTWAQDTIWIYDSALKRGMHCLIYEGPGQGAALRLQKMRFRPDWEKVLTPVLDFCQTMSGIDGDRIAAMGLSFGGYLVPRAAAFDKRVKLCIADPGNISWGESIAGALSAMKKLPPMFRPALVGNLVKDYAWKHGVENDIQTVINELQKYNNSDILEKITCKVLVMDGTAEVIPGRAEKFYAALKCPKHYMLFSEETTAQTHTQMGGYAPASEILFDWIEENL